MVKVISNDKLGGTADTAIRPMDGSCIFILKENDKYVWNFYLFWRN